MNTFNDLIDFIDLAEKNRKYPENTAQGLRAALKVFGKELKPDEFNSIHLIEERMDEIFLDVLNSNKEKYSIDSLNTYKMRLIKVIKDYARYGAQPQNMKNWIIKDRASISHKHIQKDEKDTAQDTSFQSPSEDIDSGVENTKKPENAHKIEIALDSKTKATLLIPKTITKHETEILKSILDSLTKK